MHRLVLIALLTLGACAPSVDPSAKASLDSWVAGIQTKSASYGDRGLRRNPPKVGQWTEYKDVDSDGSVIRRVQKVVGEEGGAYWIETESENYEGKTAVKVLVAVQDWNRPEGIEIRRVITQPVGEQAQEVPTFLAKAVAQPITSAIMATVAVPNEPNETVTVPAGRFETRKMPTTGLSLPFIGDTAGTAWVNTTVPLSAAVKFESKNGFRSELIDFGETGATSIITGPVRSTF